MSDYLEKEEILEEHEILFTWAEKIKKYCENRESCSNGSKCTFWNDCECTCRLAPFHLYNPKYWRLESVPVINEHDKKILEFYKKNGATTLMRGVYLTCFKDDTGLEVGTIRNEAFEFTKLQLNNSYKIDDLLR